MIHTELFNPLFSKTFKVGKDVEYLTDFSYENEKYKALETFFKEIVKNNKELIKHIGDTIHTYLVYVKYYTVYPKHEKYYIYKDFYPDFINILYSYISKLENDRSIYDNMINDLFITDNKIYSYITKLKENGVDLYPVYVKTLKNIFNDLKSRGDKLFMNVNLEKLKDMFTKLEKEIKNNRKYPIKILGMFTEFLKESKIYEVANFLTKYVFEVIPKYKYEEWYMNKENWFTKILTNEFMNKLRKTGIEIDTNILNLFSLRLITRIWDDEKDYFDDEKRYENFKKVHKYQNLGALIRKGFINPETWKYFNPEFLKQFKDFNDFIENSGIKKDGEYFTSFFYIGMKYAYSKKFISEAYEMDIVEFENYLSNLIPIQKNHIKNYIGNQNIYLYKLSSEFTDKENKITYYRKDDLINYFEVSNINSCIKNRLEEYEGKDLLGVSDDVSFIILSDENGKTIGRFIDVGDNMIINLYYNGMAYKNAFALGIKDIVSNYLRNVKKFQDNFDLEYQDITHYRPSGVEKIENSILNKMKDMKKVFYINDYIKVNRKK